MFHVASVSCFRGMFRESWGHGLGSGGWGAASQGPADGASGTPRVLRMGGVKGPNMARGGVNSLFKNLQIN